MSTALDPDEKYPLPDNIWPSFDTLWKEELSVLPEAPLDWKEREPFKAFAKKVYDKLVSYQCVQTIADQAFNDGYDDGYKDGGNDMKTEIKQVIIKI